MKYIILIGDGMADDPLPHRGGRTPLELAETPNLDALAARGTVGLARTVPEGVSPGSDTAILSICGHDPRIRYTGRAPLEAAGAGVPLAAGDTAYRCNLVTLEDAPVPWRQKKLLSHSGGAVEGEEALALMEALREDKAFAGMCGTLGIRLYPAPSFRQIAVQTGAELRGLRTAPPHDHLGEPCGPLLPHGCAAAEALTGLTALAHEVLNRHAVNEARRAAGKRPANGIWLWAEGTAAVLEQFPEKYGLRGFTVSAVPLVRGIGVLSGMDCRLVPRATGGLDTDYEGKVRAVLDGLAEGYDLALLHIEAPDECTHAGDEAGKLEAIRRIDGRTAAPLTAGLRGTGEDFRLLVLSDHKTLLSTRGHDGGPVPFLLYDSREPEGSGLPYSEAAGEKGLPVPEGFRLMELLLER